MAEQASDRHSLPASSPSLPGGLTSTSAHMRLHPSLSSELGSELVLWGDRLVPRTSSSKQWSPAFWFALMTL